MVDTERKPLVVYHGTNRDFVKFADRKPRHYRGESGEAYYFSSLPDSASEYATSFDTSEEGAHVLPVYLSLQNPLVVHFTAAPGTKADYVETKILKAKCRGYDGLIIQGIDDVHCGEDQFIAFRPEQIKSAIGNRGTFNPNDPRINR